MPPLMGLGRGLNYTQLSWRSSGPVWSEKTSYAPKAAPLSVPKEFAFLKYPAKIVSVRKTNQRKETCPSEGI